jgi:hypothetical protein
MACSGSSPRSTRSESSAVATVAFSVEPERNLHAVGGDPECHDVRAVGDLHPVEHHHRQAHIIQPAAHQLPERRAGPLDEQLGHRALARRARLPLDLLTDRLAHARVLTGQDASEHPIHHHDAQRIAVREVLVRPDRQLARIIDGTDPRAPDLDASPAERHRPTLVPVALGRAIRVVPALRADDLAHLSLHQLVHNREPDTDAQRQEPFPRHADQLAERLLNLRWERHLGRLGAGDHLRTGYVLHGGFLLFSRTC